MTEEKKILTNRNEWIGVYSLSFQQLPFSTTIIIIIIININIISIKLISHQLMYGQWQKLYVYS